MSGQNVKSAVAALVTVVLVAATPVATSVVSAQEAITLETIGAVRMAQPDEVRRIAAERENARSPLRAQQRHAEQ